MLLQDVSNKKARRMKYEAVQGAQRRGGGLGEFSLELGGRSQETSPLKKKKTKTPPRWRRRRRSWLTNHCPERGREAGGSELAAACCCLSECIVF